MPDIYDCELGWYAIKAQPKKEHLAAELLRKDVGLEAFCPRIRYTKRTRRGPVKFVEALFPCYLFGYTELRSTYRNILSTTGVAGVVHYGQHIPKVPESFILGLRQRLQEDIHEEPEAQLEKGTPVTIIEGPFKDWQAIVSGLIPGRDRVAILLDFLGQELELKIASHSLMLDGESIKGRTFRPID